MFWTAGFRKWGLLPSWRCNNRFRQHWISSGDLSLEDPAGSPAFISLYIQLIFPPPDTLRRCPTPLLSKHTAPGARALPLAGRVFRPGSTRSSTRCPGPAAARRGRRGRKILPGSGLSGGSGSLHPVDLRSQSKRSRRRARRRPVAVASRRHGWRRCCPAAHRPRRASR